MISIYCKLQEIGMQISMATHGGTYEFVLKQEQIPYDLIEPVFSRERSEQYLQAVAHMRPGYRRDDLLRHVRSEMAYFRDHGTKLVIIGFTLSSVLSTRGVGIPLVVTHLGSFGPIILEKNLFRCSEVFDSILTDPIPDSWLNRLMGWLVLRLPLGVFNAVADELGIERPRSFLDVLMGDHTLVTDVPEILGITRDEMSRWRASDTRHYRSSARLAYAGPIFARLFGSVPDDVKRFLDTDKPKVYVALASSEPKIVQRVYDTLGSMDLRAVLCAMTHDRGFGEAENILVADHLPSHLLMPMCDLAIIHGGQGSIQTAIASGIPVIGFPLQPEQNFNLYLIQRHGAGLCMSLRSLRRGRLKPAVLEVLGDTRYRESMKRLQVWQSKVDGPLEVARYVRELMEKR